MNKDHVMQFSSMVSLDTNFLIRNLNFTMLSEILNIGTDLSLFLGNLHAFSFYIHY